MESEYSAGLSTRSCMVSHFFFFFLFHRSYLYVIVSVSERGLQLCGISCSSRACTLGSWVGSSENLFFFERCFSICCCDRRKRCRADRVCVWEGWFQWGVNVCVYQTQFQMHQVNTTALFKMSPLSFLIPVKLLCELCNYDVFEKWILWDFSFGVIIGITFRNERAPL